MRPQPGSAIINRITQEVIGAGIAVHRALGPGLLESAYQECLCQELLLSGIPFERQVPLPSNTEEFASSADFVWTFSSPVWLLSK
jgi:GxxExxY protein